MQDIFRRELAHATSVSEIQNGVMRALPQIKGESPALTYVVGRWFLPESSKSRALNDWLSTYTDRIRRFTNPTFSDTDFLEQELLDRVIQNGPLLEQDFVDMRRNIVDLSVVTQLVILPGFRDQLENLQLLTVAQNRGKMVYEPDIDHAWLKPLR